MAIGDINSTAPGSGARYNDGKLAMDLIPVKYWLANWSDELDLMEQDDLRLCLEALSAFQCGDDDAIKAELRATDAAHLMAAARVFEYGAKKYAAWNWAKGMPWSVPTGCILRHAVSILGGEEYDIESGLPHMGHIVCNLIMLDWYVSNYPEGDDRPPVRQIEIVDDRAYAVPF